MGFSCRMFEALQKNSAWIIGALAGTFLAMAWTAVGCAAAKDDPEKDAETRSTPMITVTSAAFEDGAAIPKKFTPEGADVSPGLSWSGVPANTKELALICDDPDAPSPKPWVHWVVYELGPEVTSLAEGKNGGGVEGRNDSGGTGYSGPMPPKGHGTHHYHFKLYALDTKLTLPAGATRNELVDAMKGHIVGHGEVVGTYERK